MNISGRGRELWIQREGARGRVEGARCYDDRYKEIEREIDGERGGGGGRKTG